MTALVMIGQHFIEIYKSKNPTCSDTGLERYRKIVNIVYSKSYAPPVYMTHGQPKPATPIPSTESHHMTDQSLSTSSQRVHPLSNPTPRRRPGWILPADLPPEDRPPDPLRFSTATSRFTPETQNWRTNNEFYAVPPVSHHSIFQSNQLSNHHYISFFLCYTVFC
jgi:hypothetical protein